MAASAVDSNLAAHLEVLERALLDPRVRADRARVGEMLADDFLEVGASGAVFGRDGVLQALPQEHDIRFDAGAMRVCLVADGVARISYVATRTVGDDVRRSLRTSLWRCEADGDWRMVFHQGTPDTGLGSF
jgi:hypothetical protein